MKRLATILILLVLAAAFCGSGKSDALCEPKEKECTEKLCSQEKQSIDELQERLMDCSFRLPQTSLLQTARQGDRQTARRLTPYEKAACAGNSQLHLPEHATECTASRNGITSSRHNRGYYIYALRHIII